jgi:hypothetical protein
LLTLWVGSLWTVGYLVAPALFAILEDRALAGHVAGELFHIELQVSLVCAPLFLLCELAQRRRRFALAIPVLMLAAQLTIETALRPRMAAVARGGEAFAWLHGTAAMLYLAASVLGLWLVLTRPPATGSVRAL